MMRDMTKGAPLGHLFLYAVPLLLGNWLQLAYNAVDSIIAGRFIGQDALAAEGVAGPVMNLVILAISGLCIGAGVPVYAGMVVGVSPKQEDITVNVCKKKQLTNTRAAGSDDALRLVPPRKLSLEQSLEFLADDELLEVTPKSLRIRKRILDHERRMKAAHGKGAK